MLWPGLSVSETREQPWRADKRARDFASLNPGYKAYPPRERAGRGLVVSSGETALPGVAKSFI